MTEATFTEGRDRNTTAPCPNCGHCPTCGHTPPRATQVVGWACSSCGAWVYGSHLCPFRTFNPIWRITDETTGGLSWTTTNKYVLMNGAVAGTNTYAVNGTAKETVP